MDVLKPEVYWIGERCYRRNPCRNAERNFNFKEMGKNSSNNNGRGRSNNDLENEEDMTFLMNPSSSSSNSRNQGNLAPYVEEDTILCDPDESEDYAKYIVESSNSGFLSRCDIPSTLFSHIIGAKGATKKRIEFETNTRIVVPRQNERGDIVIRGTSEKEVRIARRRLDTIASQARMKREPTHFACFPLNYPQFIDGFKSFKEQVVKECGLFSRGFDELLFNKPEKIHLTLSVMTLFDERERSKAAEILKLLESQIKSDITQGDKVVVRLRGLEIMNDDPTQVDVLYAKCQFENGQLQDIADLVASSFAESGFCKENKGENVKLHCTLMNSRYLNERKQAEPENGSNYRNGRRESRPWARESFDASLILSKFKDFDFGAVQIQSVKLATRHTTGSDGFYKFMSSISL